MLSIVYFEYSLDSLLFALMNSSIHIDTILMGWGYISLEVTCYYLRKKFNFRNVHGIMNTLGLLQSK